MIERSSKNAGKLISARIISETDADMYMNFSIFMIIVNNSTTLFFRIMFHLLASCIVLTRIKFVIPFICLIGRSMSSESIVFIRPWLMILRRLAFCKGF